MRSDFPRLHPSTPPAGSRSLAAAGMLLFFLFATLLLAGALEWEHYRSLIEWQRMGLSIPEKAVLFWVLWALTAIPFLPILALAGALAWLRWTRTAWAALGTGSTLLAAWFAIDLWIQDATGNHLLSYLPYLGEPNAWNLVGDSGSLFLSAGLIFAATAAAAAGAALASHHLARLLAKSFPRLFPSPALGLLGCAIVLAVPAALPAGSIIRNTVLIPRLLAAMPFDLPISGDAEAGGREMGRFRIDVNRAMEETCRSLRPKIVSGLEAESGARIEGKKLPDVIIIIIESFRHDALSPTWLPKIDSWARTGFRLGRHYACANVTQLGMFALLYGRLPGAYDSTLKAGILPPLCRIFQNSGYSATFIAGVDFHWRGMEAFINPRTFDRLLIKDDRDWPRGDREVLRKVQEVLREGGDRPQFILAFLYSTHFDYRYPPEYEVHTPAGGGLPFFGADPSKHRVELLNRYKNAALFLDEEVGKLAAAIDPREDILILTGDHGESIFDDGKLAHCGKLSDIQTRVPFVFAGAGIPPGILERTSSHVDVLPTILHLLSGKPVPLPGCHGRDLFSDPPPPERVLLWKWRTSNLWDLVFLRSERRIKMNLWMDPPGIKVLGFCDAMGAVDPTIAPAPGEAGEWIEAIREELFRLEE